MSPEEPGEGQSRLFRAYLYQGNVTSLYPLGDDSKAYAINESSLPVSVDQAANKLTIPAFTFQKDGARILIQLIWEGDFGPIGGPSVASFVNLGTVDNYQGDSGWEIITGGSGLVHIFTVWVYCRDHTADCALELLGDGTFPANSNLDVQVFSFE